MKSSQPKLLHHIKDIWCTLHYTSVTIYDTHYTITVWPYLMHITQYQCDHIWCTLHNTSVTIFDTQYQCDHIGSFLKGIKDKSSQNIWLFELFWKVVLFNKNTLATFCARVVNNGLLFTAKYGHTAQCPRELQDQVQ